MRRVLVLVAGNLLLIAVAVFATARAMKPPPPAPPDPQAAVNAYYVAHYLDEVDQVAHHAEPHSSNALEEAIIRDFFKDKPGGTFVDIGANHFKNASNTYYLETRLGWSGLAVDALDEFKDGWAKNRPKTKFFTAFIADKGDTEETIYVAKDAMQVSSSNRSFTEDEEGAKTTPRKVPTLTLNQLLEREKVEHFDLLSMDIELAEPKALAGFDIEKYRPGLVCIEAHKSVRQAILDYFAAHHYVLVGRYLKVDPMNLYFEPLSDPTGPREAHQ